MGKGRECAGPPHGVNDDEYPFPIQFSILDVPRRVNPPQSFVVFPECAL